MVNTHAPCHHFWRKVILKRDDFRCRACGSDHRLELSHIKEKEHYDDEQESYCFDNLCCLCYDCHSAYHMYKRGLYCDLERAKKVEALFKELEARNR